MTADRIEIPDTEAGRRCIERMYDVFCAIAARQLDRAREATKAFMPTAEIVEEKAMCDGKYSALFSVPGSGQQKVTYDYRSKIIEII